MLTSIEIGWNEARDLNQDKASSLIVNLKYINGCRLLGFACKNRFYKYIKKKKHTFSNSCNFWLSIK